MGNTHGGMRVGSGRKPGLKVKRGPGVVLGHGARFAPLAAQPADLELAEPPTDLPLEQQAFWRQWAPHAVDQCTLVPATVVGFRELCEQMAIKVALWVRMTEVGIATAEAERCLKRYEKLSQRVDASLARFKLTSFGKPMEGAKPRQVAVNPWAAVAGR